MALNDMNNGEDPIKAESNSLDLARLNVSKTSSVALDCLPNLGKVKVIYGLGYGYNGIGKTVATDGNCLH
eukprot:5633302-Ditylum_brightwellii.AAC.1